MRLEGFGELQPGISKLILRQSADVEDSSNDVFGTLAFHPTNDNQLVFTLDSASLPSNTLTAVDKIIDPENVYPGNTLPAAVTGQRYLLVNPIPLGNKSFSSTFTAEANDIIEYNGTSWTISFNSSEVSTTQYVTNSNTGTQYRWTGSQWIDSYQGQYKNGFWKLELASS